MNLPAEYLDMIEFKEGNDDDDDGELNEFHIRMKYAKHHINSLISHCKQEELRNEELKEVEQLGLISHKRYIELNFERMEAQIDGLNKEVQQLKRQKQEDSEVIEELKYETEMQEEQSKLISL